MLGTRTRQAEEVRSSTAQDKYLTFRLGEEEYGLEVEKVQQIIGLTDITPVPRMPKFVRGVMNLRGKIIPVVDLRLKFGMEDLSNLERACIIVVEVPRQTERVQIGMLVDSVSEVLIIKKENIEDPASFGPEYDVEFIRGIGKVGEGIKILLDTDRVLTVSEVASVSQSKSGSPASLEPVEVS